MDIRGLWFRVLSDRYREEGGRLRERGQYGSSWSREVARIRDDIGVEGGSWFEENLRKKVGDRVDTFFWMDSWLGAIPLCERFSKLFDLSIHRWSMVRDMFSLGWGGG